MGSLSEAKKGVAKVCGDRLSSVGDYSRQRTPGVFSMGDSSRPRTSSLLASNPKGLKKLNLSSKGLRNVKI